MPKISQLGDGSQLTIENLTGNKVYGCQKNKVRRTSELSPLFVYNPNSFFKISY